MSKTAEMVKLAHSKGYRVTPDGVVLSPFGKVRKLQQVGRKKCPYYAFTLATEDAAFPVPVHKLVAFQKFGEDAFLPGFHTRHLDGNSMNNREENIQMGTGTDNALDRPEAERRAHAAKGNRKHSLDFIAKIRKEHSSGASYRELSERHGVGKSTLSYYLSQIGKRTVFTGA
jgi:hypothetical protein